MKTPKVKSWTPNPNLCIQKITRLNYIYILDKKEKLLLLLLLRLLLLLLLLLKLNYVWLSFWHFFLLIFCLWFSDLLEFSEIQKTKTNEYIFLLTFLKLKKIKNKANTYFSGFFWFFEIIKKTKKNINSKKSKKLKPQKSESWTPNTNLCIKKKTRQTKLI